MQMPNWHAEIVELHAFFQEWLDGSLEESDAAFARLPNSLDPDFMLISPSGEAGTREELLRQLRAAHASRPNWRMWIGGAKLRVDSADLLVATYEEWHQSGETTTARISTAVFRHQVGAPNGLLWLHVHETWLPNALAAQRMGVRG